MRSTILALVASSLLVKDVAAFPFGRRDLYVVQDNILVTEVVTVTAEADGTYKTGTPVAVGTATVAGVPVLMTNGGAEPAPVASTSAAQNSETQTTIEAVTTTPAAVETSTTPVAVASTEASIPAPVSTAVEASTPVKVQTTPSPAKTTAAAAVPTTTAAAPAQTTAAAPATNSANKRGLAFNDASLLSGFLGTGSKCSWSYNWGDSSTVPSGLEYVPMLWGLGSHTNGWTEAATKAIAAGSTHLLGFNEPDLGAQSNLSPADAATGWTANMQQFAGKAKLGSPAVTNGGAPMGLTWLSNFVSACKDCTIDFVNIHWYNGGDANAFKDYVQKAYTAGGNRPVWITEFEAPGNSDAEKVAFLNEVMPWLDSQSIVERYAYFGVFPGNLISSGTSLSTIGSAFAFGA